MRDHNLACQIARQIRLQNVTDDIPLNRDKYRSLFWKCDKIWVTKIYEKYWKYILNAICQLSLSKKLSQRSYISDLAYDMSYVKVAPHSS